MSSQRPHPPSQPPSHASAGRAAPHGGTKAVCLTLPAAADGPGAPPRCHIAPAAAPDTPARATPHAVTFTV